MILLGYDIFWDVTCRLQHLRSASIRDRSHAECQPSRGIGDPLDLPFTARRREPRSRISLVMHGEPYAPLA